MSASAFQLISDWFLSQCDGDWEHEFGIEIYTVSNPGWYIKIPLEETELEIIIIDIVHNIESEDDWYFIKTEENTIHAACSFNNIEKILNIIVEEMNISR